jgi:hypothetical protein
MSKVEMDPKTRPAEYGTLLIAATSSINEWFAGHYVTGTKIMLVGMAPFAVTWFLEKIGRYRPSVHGEIDL